jgi:hypothetical protein
MEKFALQPLLKHKNFVFIGEAGCGKTEIALNMALAVRKEQPRPVHFFDLDQTKPLYRSRDVRERIEAAGIFFHFAEQPADVPVAVGGVAETLQDEDCIALLDVGGGDTGSRLIRVYSALLRENSTKIFYVVNPYRPWSMDPVHIDETFSMILRAAGLEMRNLGILCNPNNGSTTTREEITEGAEKTIAMLGDVLPVEAVAAMRPLCSQVGNPGGLPVLPLDLYMTYEWVDEAPIDG